MPHSYHLKKLCDCEELGQNASEEVESVKILQQGG